jgi:hypothetical protein
MLNPPTFRRIVTSSSSRSTLKMIALRSPETSVAIYRSKQRSALEGSKYFQTNVLPNRLFLFALRPHCFFCQNYPWKARLRIVASNDRNSLQRVHAVCDELLVPSQAVRRAGRQCSARCCLFAVSPSARGSFNVPQ